MVDRRIASIDEKLKQLEAKRDQVVAAVQARCKHTVLHWSGNHAADNSSLDFPRRKCANCELEEVGSWWAYGGEFWRIKDSFDKPLLDNKDGRFIKHVSATEYYNWS